jgi:hypothetical protein
MTTHTGVLDAADEPRGTPAVPWFLYAVLFASTSVLLGIIWDISWHRTIGRDTFWTPAHLGIYTGGIVAGLTCGWLALRATFSRVRPGEVTPRIVSVRFWGFYAPFGAWVCIWGTFAMLTSAPFDDWWHNTYGLDVKILSPPHALLAAGIGAIQVGAMLMILAWQNRSAVNRTFARLFLLAAGLLLINAATLATEYTQRWDMHRALFWMVTCGVFPFFLVSTARASIARWPATGAALIYSGITLLMVIVLPRFEAHPLLGPIYVQVDRFMPPDFPLLLVVPALAIDVAMSRFGRSAAGTRRDWLLAAAIGTLFLVAFLPAQWPFADFLMTPWARNWLFATHHMPYSASPDFQARWFRLNPADNVTAALPIALILAFVSARCGLWWGTWMSRVRR